jgi:16S rRNA (cytidine1402-2'-O)-methyltransferase
MPILYLMPNTLAQTWPQTACYYQQVLPTAALDIATQLKYWVVENAKSARALLKDIAQNYRPLQTPLQAQEMAVINQQNDIKILLAKAFTEGQNIGLLSEAGVPCVADPGSWVVAYARAQGFEVKPLTGPCSIILGLMSSGFDLQKFIFHSYLPIKSADKQQFIQQTKQGLMKDYIHIAIETPYRNTAFIGTLVDTLSNHGSAKLCVAKHLTLATEKTISEDIKLWQKHLEKYMQALNENTALDNSPAIFLWRF